MANWCVRGVVALTAVALMAACQAPPVGAPEGASVAGAAAPSGLQGTAEFTITLPSDKTLGLGGRRVQAVDLSRATSIDVYVSGAGINGWQPVQTGRLFGAADPTTGDRVATFSGNVAAGAKRIFRLTIKDGSGTLETLWGLGDITVGQTTAITINRHTTATAQVLRKLILGGDTAKALAIPVSDAQAFIDKLLNTHSATGAPIDATAPQINYSLLNVDLAASAIAKGEGGVGYTVPTSLPAYLVPTPVKKGAIRVKVFDVKGQPVTNSCAIFATDYASKVVTSPANTAVDQTLQDVTPGDWTVTVVDIVTGRTAQKSVSIVDTQTKELSLSLPPAATEKAVGAYNLELNQTYGYNEEGMHPSLTYLNTPGRMVMNGTYLYFADVGNKRIRRVDLASNSPEVQTVAGNGGPFAAGAPDGSNAKNVPIGINANCHLFFLSPTELVFSEQGAQRLVKLDLTTGLLSQYIYLGELLKTYSFDAPTPPGSFVVDTVTNSLYVTPEEYILGRKLIKVDLATGTTTATIASNCTGGLLLSRTAKGNFLFFASGYGDQRVYRRNLDTSVNETIIGKNRLYSQGDGVPAQDAWFDPGSGSFYGALSLDALGNLYLLNEVHGGQIYRVTKALDGTDASNEWVINNLALANTALSKARGLAIDASTGNVYYSGVSAIPNPNGAGTVDIHAISVMRP